MSFGLGETQSIQRKKNEIFKSKKHLGSGTFGRVEKCLSRIDNKTYAVKIIENVSAMDIDTIKSEAVAMMRAKSDYSVKLLDHFEDRQSSSYLFIMPYYRKGNLTEYMKKQWSPSNVLCFLYQVCMAFLSFENAEAVWHLDLKPDNILIKAEGEYLICDFGCAKLVDNTNFSQRLSLSIGKGAGTTEYAAPEIILHYEGSKYSDIWSIGVIVYKILYKGRHPISRPGQVNTQLYKNFTMGVTKIQYQPIPGFEPIIDILKRMLEPQKRLVWQQLRKSIYNFLNLPLRTTIITNIQSFITFAEDCSKVVLGLVYYLSKNAKNLQKLELSTPADKLIESCKVYTTALYSQVQQAIQGNLSKKSYSNYYVFPQIKKHYSFQQKQRLDYLIQKASAFCKKQVEQQFTNIKMNFICEVDDFLRLVDGLEPAKLNLHPIYEWEKVRKICQFIILKTKDKRADLEYENRHAIHKFAEDIVES